VLPIHLAFSHSIYRDAMKAIIDGVVIAQANESDLVRIEGNWYFPPASVKAEYLTKSPTAYTCSWKGACQYYTLEVNGQSYQDRAFSYDDLIPGAVERVGTDFSRYVSFWKDVSVEE
jgi:uncharacterized protein (DUF427 family)|tara:strand:- start:54 stop:404 length:351 start_codon:yes stop_codon:yes gene_type:complete